MRHANRQVNDTRVPVQQRAWKRKKGKRSKKYANQLATSFEAKLIQWFWCFKKPCRRASTLQQTWPWVVNSSLPSLFQPWLPKAPVWGCSLADLNSDPKMLVQNLYKITSITNWAKWLKRQQSESTQNSKSQTWPNKKIECCASHPRFWIPDRSCASVIVIPSSKYWQTRSPLTTNGCAFRSCFNARADFRKHWPGMLFQRCTTTANPMQTIWWKVTGWLDMLEKHDTKTMQLCLA